MTARILTLSDFGGSLSGYIKASTIVHNALSNLEVRVATYSERMSSYRSTVPRSNSSAPGMVTQDALTKSVQRLLGEQNVKISDVEEAEAALRTRIDELHSSGTLDEKHPHLSPAESISQAEANLDVLHRAAYSYSRYASLHSTDKVQNASMALIDKEAAAMTKKVIALDVDELVRRSHAIYADSLE